MFVRIYLWNYHYHYNPDSQCSSCMLCAQPTWQENSAVRLDLARAQVQETEGRWHKLIVKPTRASRGMG